MHICAIHSPTKAINHKDEDFSFQISVTNVQQKLVPDAHVGVMIAVHTFMHIQKSKQN